ncbi:MAG: polysaccharide pyruvyl transferase family protein [Candidatus Pacebacteria bacterium]|nr:polysaccharide pyruvyl transferase family protein [Candidatus Paceibacterota bacterium]
MKIVIANAYAKGSGGDMAILSVLIAEMRRVFDNPDITVATIDTNANMEPLFPDVRFVPSLITTIWDEESKNRIAKLYSLLRNGSATVLWSLAYRFGKKRPDWLLQKAEKEAMNRLADADLVVGVGGGYIREIPGFMRIMDLALTLRMLYLSQMMGKLTVLHSQSVGPFGNKAQEKFAGYVLRKMQFIITRESISLKLLKKMGVKEDLTMGSVDAAFLVRGKNYTRKPLPEEFTSMKKAYAGPLIGVTARDWLDKKAQARYEKEMAIALDHIAEKYDACIVFIPQTTVERNTDDDRIIEKRIFENMRQKNRAVLLEGSYDHQTLLSIYESLDFLIGTRFHSVIFALTAKVPALVIAYEHKAEGIMEDLGLAEWVIKMENVESSLMVDAFVKLYEEKDIYLKHLEKALSGYIVEAEKSAETIREIYLSYKSTD